MHRFGRTMFAGLAIAIVGGLYVHAKDLRRVDVDAERATREAMIPMGAVARHHEDGDDEAVPVVTSGGTWDLRDVGP